MPRIIVIVSFVILFAFPQQGFAQKSLAEDPSTIQNEITNKAGENVKPWVDKSGKELQNWAKENLHRKLVGKKLIKDQDHPEWAWFRKSGLGIFLHWGLASAPPNNGNAWAMVFNKRRHETGQLIKPEDMFAVADHWNPEQYDPDKWMKAASKAGFGYSVLTTRHHDGYCLWPSEHGQWDTGEKMGGRDLLKDYVTACRNHDIRVGLYYSGPNWHFAYKHKDFSHPSQGYNYRHEKVEASEKLGAIMGGGLPADLAKAEKAESKGQVTELLTKYGTIDMLWWDGSSIMPESEVHELQPNTFVARGNIATPEGLHQGASRNVKVTNEAGWWWEMCAKAENKHSPYWHYNKQNENPQRHWSTNKLLTELIRCRSLGGNLLVNITPRPNGEMMDIYYTICGEMEQWMQHSKEAIYDVQLTAPLPTLDKTQNFTTVKKDAWYSLPDDTGSIAIQDIPAVASVKLLRTGEDLEHTYHDGALKLTVPQAMQTELPDLVKITFK